MTLRKNSDGYWQADLRASGGPRLSLHTESKDVARVLHNEVEQRVLRGEKVTGQVVRALLTSMTTPQARLAASAMPVPVAAPESKRAAGVTLRQAFELARVEREDWRDAKSPKTIEENYKHVATYFGDARALDSITTTDMQGFKMALLEAGKSHSTINQRLSLVSVLFDEADKAGYPVVKPKLRRAKVKPGRKRILSRDEERAVITWFNDHEQHDMADLTVCLVDTGFRLSEMLGIEDVVGISWEGGRVIAHDTKNRDSRSVPMTQRVRDVLVRRVRAHGRKPFGMLTVTGADNRWSTMREALGLSNDSAFVIHALRHTCCTRMALAGKDPFRIMQWMGHRNIETTMIYVHLAGAELGALRDALETVTASVRGDQPGGVECTVDQGPSVQKRIDSTTGTDS